MAFKVSGIATIVTEPVVRTWESKTTGKPFASVNFKVSSDREFLRFNKDKNDIFSVSYVLPAGSPDIRKFTVGTKMFIDGAMLIDDWKNDKGEDRRSYKIELLGCTFLGTNGSAPQGVQDDDQVEGYGDEVPF